MTLVIILDCIVFILYLTFIFVQALIVTEIEFNVEFLVQLKLFLLRKLTYQLFENCDMREISYLIFISLPLSFQLLGFFVKFVLEWYSVEGVFRLIARVFKKDSKMKWAGIYPKLALKWNVFSSFIFLPYRLSFTFPYDATLCGPRYWIFILWF